MTDYEPDKGDIAPLGNSLNAIDAVNRFDRRYLVVPLPMADHAAVFAIVSGQGQ